jgi:hypothetical protein
MLPSNPALLASTCSLGKLTDVAQANCTVAYAVPEAAALSPGASITTTVSFAPLPWNVVDDSNNNVAAACITAA